MDPCVHSETQLLTHVLLGSAISLGSVPKLEDLYDPTSRKHLITNSFPTKEAMHVVPKLLDPSRRTTAAESVIELTCPINIPETLIKNA